jgi:phenylacetate-CoA ligase
MKSKRYFLDSQKIVKEIQTKKDTFWQDLSHKNAIAIFKEVSKKVPAYKAFLKAHNIQPNKINTWNDFQSVPIVSKQNYLKQNQLKDLCFDGSLNKPLVFTSTSGSTGEPYYFPRNEK